MTREITIDDLKRYRALVETGSVLDKNTVLNIISHAGEAAETILRKQNAIDTLDRIITQQCQAALDATGLHHLIDEDGDGDWSAVWEGLQDLQATSKPNQNFEVVATAEELGTTRAGLALANQAFKEGLSAGISACNASGPDRPFVKPDSPYSAPLLAMIKADREEVEK